MDDDLERTWTLPKEKIHILKIVETLVAHELYFSVNYLRNRSGEVRDGFVTTQGDRVSLDAVERAIQFWGGQQEGTDRVII